MVIVILTHGMFGEELLHAAEMIIGRQKLYLYKVEYQ